MSDVSKAFCQKNEPCLQYFRYDKFFETGLRKKNEISKRSSIFKIEDQCLKSGMVWFLLGCLLKNPFFVFENECILFKNYLFLK